MRPGDLAAEVGGGEGKQGHGMEGPHEGLAGELSSFWKEGFLLRSSAIVPLS